MRRISVFGSTGSIGKNTMDLLQSQGGNDAFNVVALTGGKNIGLLAEQARRFSAEFAVTCEAKLQDDLKDLLRGTDTRVLAGPGAIQEIAGEPTDWAMSAIVGAAGLGPTMALTHSTQTIALANKETMVCAGGAFRDAADAGGARIIPVDSEHSAIFQCLEKENRAAVDRIVLTASGGPFRTWPSERIANATVKDALNHPNWSMGQRITIDSASMFNKALEMIEAKELFDLSSEQIDVVVHPQSIVHSMVAYVDGSVIAQLSQPDMRGPIGYALNYPSRDPLPLAGLDFCALGRLDFEPPDEQRFPAFGIARDAMSIGGAAGAVLNAAKETALDAFLDGSIGFADMASVVAIALEKLEKEAAQIKASDGITPILELDALTRRNCTTYMADMAEPPVMVNGWN